MSNLPIHEGPSMAEEYYRVSSLYRHRSLTRHLLYSAFDEVLLWTDELYKAMDLYDDVTLLLLAELRAYVTLERHGHYSDMCLCLLRISIYEGFRSLYLHYIETQLDIWYPRNYIISEDSTEEGMEDYFDDMPEDDENLDIILSDLISSDRFSTHENTGGEPVPVDLCRFYIRVPEPRMDTSWRSD